MERPILFSGPMVRALLDGRKTQTRRIVTSATSKTDGTPWAWLDFGSGVFVDRSSARADGSYQYLHVPRSAERTPEDHDATTVHRVFARYEPGDTLWVRETWAWQHLCCDPDCESSVDGWVCKEHALAYRATPPEEPGTVRQWRPSIFMPRRACRLLRRVVSVRPERLWEITPGDVLAEGLTAADDPCAGDMALIAKFTGRPIPETSAPLLRAFAGAWDRINGKRATWASNPWVWRVAFEVIL